MTTQTSPRPRRSQPSPETYTPGHTNHSTSFMARRSLVSHGAFVEPWLGPGLNILDCGCGPGTITLGLAEAVFPGTATGIDAHAESIERARQLAWGLEQVNTSFQTASIYALPFPDATFDLVFSHALFEHLAWPQAALQELRRVLRPGGRVALCSPDWDAFDITPLTAETEAAIRCYRQLQHRHGGDTATGGKLSAWLQEADFEVLEEKVRMETYESPALIGDYLVRQLEGAGESGHAEALRRWHSGGSPVFSQAWSSVVAFR